MRSTLLSFAAAFAIACSGCIQQPAATTAKPPAVARAAAANPAAVRAADPSAKRLAGLVVGIADGDTLTVLDAEKNQHKIRLHGIDTPESSQAFGTRAKQALSEKVFQKNIRVDHATVCTSSKTHVLLERNESSSSVSRLDE